MDTKYASQIPKSTLKRIVLATAFGGVSLVLVFCLPFKAKSDNQDQPVITPPIADMLGYADRYEEQQRAQNPILLKMLQNEAMWHNPANGKYLLAAIRNVEALQITSAAPILVEHIDYNAEILGPGRGMLPASQNFPAARALRNLGPAAVPAILNGMKSLDPDVPIEHQRPVSSLIVDMIFIYQKGGYGKKMAMRRVELEAERSSGIQKEYLLRNLKNPQWTVELPDTPITLR